MKSPKDNCPSSLLRWSAGGTIVSIQLGFFSNQEKREQLERLDKAVDTVRQRYGYACVQRARIYTDKGLGKISPKEDHLVHPVGFFNAG